MSRRAQLVKPASLVAVVAILLLSATVSPTKALGVLANPDILSTRHDRPATVAAPGVLANDVTILGTTAVLVSGTSHGTVTLAPNGGYTYDPAAGFVGTDVFKYKDSGLLTNTVSVTITVTNAAPVAVDDAYAATTGVTLTIPGPGVLGNDHDADGDGLTATLVDGSGNGSLSLLSDGRFTFKSGGSFVGTRTFTYEVFDGLVWSSTATVSIQVSAPSSTPTPSPAPTATPTPTVAPGQTATPGPTATTAPSTPPTGPIPSAPPTRPPWATPPPVPDPNGTPTDAPPASPTEAPLGATPSASAGMSPIPGSSSAPSPSDPGSGAGAAGSQGGGAAPGAAGASRFTVGSGTVGPFGLIADVGLFDNLAWAVPVLFLTVPGLLLMLAVLAQVSLGTLWLPVVRRWLGGFGVERRRRSQQS